MGDRATAFAPIVWGRVPILDQWERRLPDGLGPGTRAQIIEVIEAAALEVSRRGFPSHQWGAVRTSDLTVVIAAAYGGEYSEEFMWVNPTRRGLAASGFAIRGDVALPTLAELEQDRDQLFR